MVNFCVFKFKFKELLYLILEKKVFYSLLKEENFIHLNIIKYR